MRQSWAVKVCGLRLTIIIAKGTDRDAERDSNRKGK